MASLSDILTTAKNVVTAINNVSQTYLNVNGTKRVAKISTTTVVSTAQGRLATLSITTGGSASG
ncbi:MAG: hypothetical protein KGL39_50870, partial [Patescibacteria group bacterium]|nr:hypothetical protein [Patescibacteria group bacterium]